MPAYDADGQVRTGAWVAEVTGLLNLSTTVLNERDVTTISGVRSEKVQQRTFRKLRKDDRRDSRPRVAEVSVVWSDLRRLWEAAGVRVLNDRCDRLLAWWALDPTKIRATLTKVHLAVMEQCKTLAAQLTDGQAAANPQFTTMLGRIRVPAGRGRGDRAPARTGCWPTSPTPAAPTAPICATKGTLLYPVATLMSHSPRRS
jgi:hypothetical protein